MKFPAIEEREQSQQSAHNMLVTCQGLSLPIKLLYRVRGRSGTPGKRRVMSGYNSNWRQGTAGPRAEITAPPLAIPLIFH